VFRQGFVARHFVSRILWLYPFGRAIYWGGRGWLEVNKDGSFAHRTSDELTDGDPIVPGNCDLCLTHMYCLHTTWDASVTLLDRRWARRPRNRGSILDRTGYYFFVSSTRMCLWLTSYSLGTKSCFSCDKAAGAWSWQLACTVEVHSAWRLTCSFSYSALGNAVTLKNKLVSLKRACVVCLKCKRDLVY
jgi:hypothetical protein